jgi:hypothetical protein
MTFTTATATTKRRKKEDLSMYVCRYLKESLQIAALLSKERTRARGLWRVFSLSSVRSYVFFCFLLPTYMHHKVAATLGSSLSSLPPLLLLPLQ